MPDDVLIFIGCSANHEDIESQAVLEYTIRQHASKPVNIVWMKQSRDPESRFFVGNGGWATQYWATPFSGFRWGVPVWAHDMGYERGIYMDSDFIVFGDIAELYATPMRDSKAVVASRSGRFCCSLWKSVESSPFAFNSFRSDPQQHMKQSAFFTKGSTKLGSDQVQHFAADADWNYLDLANIKQPLPPPSHVKAIHYTQMHHQLQLKHALPRLADSGKKHWYTGVVREHPWVELQAYFDVLLGEAIAAGFALDKYTQAAPFGDYKIRGR